MWVSLPEALVKLRARKSRSDIAQNIVTYRAHLDILTANLQNSVMVQNILSSIDFILYLNHHKTLTPLFFKKVLVYSEALRMEVKGANL